MASSSTSRRLQGTRYRSYSACAAAAARHLTDEARKPPHVARQSRSHSFVRTQQSHLLRDDGKIDRIGTGDGGKPGMALEAVDGCTYLLACSGDSGASYFLRSDGQFDRTVGKGLIHESINTAQEAEKSCIVM